MHHNKPFSYLLRSSNKLRLPVSWWQDSLVGILLPVVVIQSSPVLVPSGSSSLSPDHGTLFLLKHCREDEWGVVHGSFRFEWSKDMPIFIFFSDNICWLKSCSLFYTLDIKNFRTNFRTQCDILNFVWIFFIIKEFYYHPTQLLWNSPQTSREVVENTQIQFIKLRIRWTSGEVSDNYLQIIGVKIVHNG